MPHCHCTGNQLVGGRKKKSKRKYRKFGKRSKSLTDPGKLDFTTKKRSKLYNRDSHRQRYSADGKRDHPFGQLLKALGDPETRRKRGKKKGRKAKKTRSTARKSALEQLADGLGGAMSNMTPKQLGKEKKRKSKRKKRRAAKQNLSIAKCFSF